MKFTNILLLLGVMTGIVLSLAIVGYIQTNEDDGPRFTGEFDVQSDQLLYALEHEGLEIVFVDEEKIYEADPGYQFFDLAFARDEVLFIHTTGYDDQPAGEGENQLRTSEIINDAGDVIVEARGVLNQLVYDETNDELYTGGIQVSQGVEPEQGFEPLDEGFFKVEEDGSLTRIFDRAMTVHQVLDEGQFVVTMYDDYELEERTADSIFDSVSRSYLFDPNTKEVELLSGEETEVDVSQSVIYEDELLYQTIMNPNSNENYDYDLVYEGERLNIGSAVGNILLQDDQLYYTKRDQSGYQKKPTVTLHTYDLLQGMEEEVTLVTD
ncbi:hypothetical protein [Geomicrobium sediminis]|uniref:DUF4340 domain-containing protein n=1 Tax=Geomicrobium sediminis TaxID=1347788 RepID=A0ABS2PBP9_9BACL|nr:hypothetical protein [Geomicrobium sediminis]MBM7632839.1 hypothetical protein [Geomicrobium sediminis]